MKAERTPRYGVTARAVLIALLLTPLNCYWIMQIEVVWYSGHPTCASIFYNVVFSLLVVMGCNAVWRMVMPRHALYQGELLTIYVMLGIASSIASHDMLQILVPTITHASKYATPENEWARLFGWLLPSWLTVDDSRVLTAYYEGDRSFLTLHHIRAWTPAMLWWGAFIVVLLFVMACINTLVRKAWTEDEKLSYPMIQLPLALTEEGGSSGLFRNRLLWAGILLAGGIDVLNGISFYLPYVPSVPVKYSQSNIGSMFTTKPWNAVGYLPLPLYPFAIGLAYFLPVDLSFSIWFFYLFRKGQQVLGSALGLHNLPGFPYLNEQSSGAWIGFAILTFWATRRHLRRVFASAFAGGATREEERGEALPYRVAVTGLACGFALLVAFSMQAGMSAWAAVLFFLTYFAISTAITRMRAELGPPTHELTPMNAAHILVDVFGTRRLGPRNLTVMSLYWFFNRSYRNHPMPAQLEGYKMAERVGMNNRRLLMAMMLAVIVAVPASFASLLHMSYKAAGAPGSGFAWETFNRLQSRMLTPTDPDGVRILFLGIGFVFTFLLMVMRMRFLHWPFHPAGYALSTNFGIDYIWFCLVVASVAKLFILKYGGIKAHRRAVPFFLGLILGEFAVGSFWSALSVIIQQRTYTFWIF
jgi:hypothetical protein